jgi:hypothetical protein
VGAEKVNCGSRFSYPNFIPQHGIPAWPKNGSTPFCFAATILAARKLIDADPNKPSMAKGFFVNRAIEAAFILERIDARWPTIVNSFSAKEP